jgi:hypothetical protein
LEEDVLTTDVMLAALGFLDAFLLRIRILPAVAIHRTWVVMLARGLPETTIKPKDHNLCENAPLNKAAKEAWLIKSKQGGRTCRIAPSYLADVNMPYQPVELGY